MALAWASSPRRAWLCAGLLGSSCLPWEWWHRALLLPPGASCLSTVRICCGPRGHLHCPFYPARTPWTRILVMTPHGLQRTQLVDTKTLGRSCVWQKPQDEEKAVARSKVSSMCPVLLSEGSH